MILFLCSVSSKNCFPHSYIIFTGRYKNIRSSGLRRVLLFLLVLQLIKEPKVTVSIVFESLVINGAIIIFEKKKCLCSDNHFVLIAILFFNLFLLLKNKVTVSKQYKTLEIIYFIQ